MELILKRNIYSAVSTIGELYFLENNKLKLLCNTLENSVKPIDEKPCIPIGKYNIKITYSPHFKVEMPELIDVPNYTGVRIHIGNSQKDTAGCILVGEYQSSKPDWISNSTYHYVELINLLKKYNDHSILII